MIRTKASLLAKNADSGSSFQVVTFDKSSRKRLPKTAPPNGKKGKDQSDSDSEFERVFGDGPKKKKSKNDKSEVTYQSARREIINFGIAGSTASDKVDLNQQLALKLGAKPQKKAARNYKEILEEKRKQKLEDKNDSKRTMFGTSASLQNKSKKKTTNRKDAGLTKRYGKVEKGDQEKNSKIGKQKR